MEMDDNKRRRNMILYVLIAFVVYLVLSTVLFPNIGHTQQITKTDYSTFVKALDKKSVDKVEYMRLAWMSPFRTKKLHWAA